MAKVDGERQAYVAAAELRAAGLDPGEQFAVRAEGPGRVILEREGDLPAGFVGGLTGVYVADELDALRREWD